MPEDSDVQQRLNMQEQNRASDQAAEAAAQMARQQMEEVKRNPDFADTIRDADLPADYKQDLGPDASKAHAVANLSKSARERIYWLNKNKRERRIVESQAGHLLKENPKMLAIAQEGVQPAGIEAADSEPMTAGQKRRMRGSFDVSHALKTLGVENAGLEALTKATAEHRTVTNEQQEESGVKSKVRAFFD